jgi:hypothetical protein
MCHELEFGWNMENISASAVLDNGEQGLPGVFKSSNIFMGISWRGSHRINYVQISKTVTKIEHQKLSARVVAPRVLWITQMEQAPNVDQSTIWSLKNVIFNPREFYKSKWFL